MTSEEITRIRYVIRTKAAEAAAAAAAATDTIDARLIELAAWLYAVCICWHKRRHSLPGPTMVADGAYLGVLADASSTDDQFIRAAVDTIVQIDSRVADNTPYQKAWSHKRQSFHLSDPLSGTVDVWISAGASRFDESNRLRRGAKQRPSPQYILRFPNRGLTYFWRHSGSIPAVCVDDAIERDPGFVHSWKKGLRVALCPLHDGLRWGVRVKTTTVDTSDGSTFKSTFTAASDSAIHDGGFASEWAAVRRRADDCCVDLVVLPELTVDQPTRNTIVTSLQDPPSSRPVAVVAGSFHGAESEEAAWTASDAEAPVNRSVVVSNQGKLWSCEKSGRFTVWRRDLNGLQSAGWTIELSGVPEHDHEIEEGVVRGGKIHFAHTEMGRVAVIICADALDYSIHIRETLAGASIDLVMVVSMSPETMEFETFAREMGKQGVSTLFVNARALTRPGNLLAMAWFSLEQLDDPACPPSGVGWFKCNGGDELKRWCFKQKQWIHPDPSTVPGVALMSDSGGRSLGLLVDLRVYLEYGRSKKRTP